MWKEAIAAYPGIYVKPPEVLSLYSQYLGRCPNPRPSEYEEGAEHYARKLSCLLINWVFGCLRAVVW
jgi:hypothetical protein